VCAALAVLLVACSESPPAPAPPPSTDTGSELLPSEYHMLELRLVAGGLEHPWSVAFLPDGRFLVTERPGRLNLVTPEGVVTRIDGLPGVLARNQGGLMEVALHPDFGNNGWVYLSYSRGNWRNNESWLVLARGRLEGERLRGVEELFRQDQPHWSWQALRRAHRLAARWHAAAFNRRPGWPVGAGAGPRPPLRLGRAPR
jgi:glucose/arabinose dehydrogenase